MCDSQSISQSLVGSHRVQPAGCVGSLGFAREKTHTCFYIQAWARIQL